MYKYNTNMLPIKFNNLSFSHATLRLNSIRHAGPRTWNNFPHDLKVACSLSVFIRKMKSLFIKDYNQTL